MVWIACINKKLGRDDMGSLHVEKNGVNEVGDNMNSLHEEEISGK